MISQDKFGVHQKTLKNPQQTSEDSSGCANGRWEIEMMMNSAYESRRVVFEGILKKYLEYVKLYAAFNNGSLEGLTPFHDFYWRFTYITRYSNPQAIARSGY